ncbi:MAG: hypothetical protein ACI4R8_05055 [Candidatus Caccovivens sp.]
MKNLLKKLNAFQIVSIILIGILLVAIIIQIGVMVNLKNQTEERNKQNEEITSQLPENNEIEAEFLKNLNFDYQP